YTGGITLGASGDKARATVSVGVNRQSNLLTSDRDWTNGNAVAQIGNPATFISLSQGLLPDPDCTKAPRSFLAPSAGGGSFCSVDAGDFGDLMPPTERLTTLGYGEYDLTDHTMAFLETGLSSLRAQLRI